MAWSDNTAEQSAGGNRRIAGLWTLVLFLFAHDFSPGRASAWPFGDTPMIKKVLIADHGDVAIRLLTEFKRAGVKTVTVYTQEDCNSEHVQLADESICIGKTFKSYHNDWHRVISAAEISEVDAVHPGEGPLSTHERFAEVCAEIGLQFLGRNAEQGGFT